MVSFQVQTTHVQYLNQARGQQPHPGLISLAVARWLDRLSHCSARHTRVAVEQCKERVWGRKKGGGWESVKREKEQKDRSKENVEIERLRVEGEMREWRILSWVKDREAVTTVIVEFREGSACFTVWEQGPFYSFWFTLYVRESISTVWMGGRVQ